MFLKIFRLAFKQLHQNFVAGVLVIVPIAVTFYALSAVVSFFLAPLWDAVSPWALWLLDIVVPDSVSTFLINNVIFLQIYTLVLPLLFILVAIVLLGFFMRYILVKQLFGIFDLAVQQIPIVSLLYQTTREVVGTLVVSNNTSFKTVVLVPWGEAKVMGFLNNYIEIHEDSPGESVCSVFVPTAPSPISGFIFMYKKKDIQVLNIPVEDAFKFIISFGMIFQAKHHRSI